MAAQVVHWCTGVADASLSRAAADVERELNTQALRTEFGRAVGAEGSAFVDRLEGGLHDIVRAFNARIGHPMLTAQKSSSGVVSIMSSGAVAWVRFVADLQTSSGNIPTISVTVRQYGRDRLDHYPFLLHNERLHIECAGAVMGPEQFVRAQLEPWLQALPVSR